MDGSVVQTYLSDVLHAVSQSLLAPDIVLLLAFIAYALFCIGSIIAERFSERQHFTVTMPRFLADLMAADEDEIPAVIKGSGLLKRQKSALLTVYDYRMLPGDALVALIKRLVNEEETRYDRISGRNNMAARVAPMLGLMGTLIPLGPGIQALGKADVETLSSSLLVAFDTTVAGLVVAAICLVVGKIRGNWYGNYMSALDSAMATMLQKIEDMRAEGKITITEPTDYAFLYGAETNQASKKHAEAQSEHDVVNDGAALAARGAGAYNAGASFDSAGTAASASTGAAGAAYPMPSVSASSAASVASVASPAPSAMSGFAPSAVSSYGETDIQQSAQRNNTWSFESVEDTAPVQAQSAQSWSSDLRSSVPGIESVSAPSPLSSGVLPKIDFASAASTANMNLPQVETSEAQAAREAIPPVENMPMPSFLDALEAAAPAVETAAQDAQAELQAGADNALPKPRQQAQMWGTAPLADLPGITDANKR